MFRTKLNSLVPLLLMLAASMACAGAWAEEEFVYYISPNAVGTSDGSCLVLNKRRLFRQSVSYLIVCRKDEALRSEQPREFWGDCATAAYYEGLLYVFHSNTFTLYRDLRDIKSHSWPYPSWSPKCAVSNGRALYVVGVDRNRLTVATLAEGEWAQGEPSEAPSVEIVVDPAGEKKDDAAGRQGIASSYLVVAAAYKAGFLAVVSGKAEGGRISLLSCTYAGGRWGQWSAAATLPETADYTLSGGGGGEVHLLYRDRRGRISKTAPLWDRTWQSTRWSEARDSGLREQLFSASQAMAGCDVAGEAHVLFVSSLTGVVTEAAYRDGVWRSTGQMIRLPALLGPLDAYRIINLGVTVLMIVAVAVSLLVHRGRPTTGHVGDRALQLASWRRRVAAYTVDFIAVYLGSLILISVFPLKGVNTRTVVLSPAFVVPFLVYFGALEAATGQTLGKMLMEIAVVGADGERATMIGVVVRTLLRLIEGLAIPLLGLVVLLNTRNSQRIGDLLGHTYVVVRQRQPVERSEWGGDDFE